ncbi:het domain-containing protein [Fusarium napiforme]|uniref:Het domain-containing protein n=1 Tax=Fusarium napiforme TaxID=42672 RepID=A0A8H5K4D4_9HYPO|nr:het domain-containing protein [Fusarium napiforme]
MRLINTTTLEVEEFFDVSIPEHAILSHTWGDGEVSLQDWADLKNRRFKPGFQKIVWACAQAAKDQLTHFFSSTWTMIATSAELAPSITAITGIPWSRLLKGRLSKSHPLRRYSIAQRISWASRRSTTRIEDQAYSLLGLFDISMPLVYGEGYGAFTRLLGEIIHKYADQSFFASQLQYVDFLPRSPMEFRESQSVIISSSPQLQRHYQPADHSYSFHLTNTGLQISLPIVPTVVPHFVFGVLDCWDVETASTTTTRNVSRVWVPLIRKGNEVAQRYLRLIWPQTFFPVKLPRKQNILSDTEKKLFSNREGHAAPDPDKTSDHVDTVSITMQSSILVKKPYASILSIPSWQPREAGSPFLLCFPRGTSGYRLYGIFPSHRESDLEWATETPPLLPLIMPRQIGQISPSINATGTSVQEKTEIYAAVIVFKKRGSKPAESENRVIYEPRCKIIPNWSPASDQDMKAVDFCAFPEVDHVAKGREHRFVGLTQVIFDRRKMVEELRFVSGIFRRTQLRVEGMDET